MKYRPIIKIINTAVINEKALFKHRLLKNNNNLFNTKYVSSLSLYLFIYFFH